MTTINKTPATQSKCQQGVHGHKKNKTADGNRRWSPLQNIKTFGVFCFAKEPIMSSPSRTGLKKCIGSLPFLHLEPQ